MMDKATLTSAILDANDVRSMFFHHLAIALSVLLDLIS